MRPWPVQDPPINPQPPRINLRGAPPDPADFDGPLNLFIHLHGTAVAFNTAEETKKEYDTNVPAAPLSHEAPAPAPSSPSPAPRPISVGRKIIDARSVIDPTIKQRITHRARPARYLVNPD